MLSNKLTFSLALVVLLAVAAMFTGIADAQDVNVWSTGSGAPAVSLSDNAFVVVAKDEASVEAGDATDDGILDAADVVQAINLPDLAHFFNTDVDIFGGTLEVLVLDMVSRVDPGTDTAAEGDTAEQRANDIQVGPHRVYGDVIVTEIMWGHDQTPADPADPQQAARDGTTGQFPPGPGVSQDPANKQWVELYNNTGGNVFSQDENATLPAIILRFHPDQYVASDMYTALTTDATTGAVTAIGADTATGAGEALDALPELATLGTAAAGDALAIPLTYYYYRVTDRVSNVKFARWALPGSGGNTQVNAQFATTNSLESAYRKAELDSTRQMYKENADGVAAFAAGDVSDGWIKSIRRKNIRGPYVATPGSSHVYEELAVTAATKTVVPSDSVVINEFRNDDSDANIDWIELHNRSDADINVNDWQISFVLGAYMQTMNATPQDAHYDRTARNKGKDGEDDYFDLPDRVIPAGGYLLIVNRQPHDTPLGATGSPLAGAGQDGKGGDGAKHQYHVDTGLDFPNVEHYLIVLRSKVPDFKNGDSEDAYIEDIAGRAWTDDGKVIAAFQDTATFRFNTDIWPLKGWVLPSGLEVYDKIDAFASESMAMERTGYDKDKWFADGSWAVVGEKDGVGYDRNVNLGTSPGTPGYANGAVGKAADLEHGVVSISEIMWDAGPRLDLVQWIELYNSSPSETINLDGWSLEIRNKDDDDIRISPVDAIVPFNNAPQILPNQTLLIVSAAGPNNIDSDNHVYNLSVENKDDLRLRVRRDVLLSEAGFYLALMDADKKVVDIAGNLSTSRKAPKVLWELPPGIENLSESRKSMRRLYGVPDVDLGQLVWGEAGADAPSDGQGLLALERRGKGLNNAVEATADNVDHTTVGWLLSDLQGTSHYGHRNDFGNPGYRRGGALPVSLSSFRPVRDKATGEVVIRWRTESELNNAGFNILRRETENGEFKIINLKGIILGQGTTNERTTYEWIDKTAKPNVVYYYQIQDISIDGKRTTLATTHLRGNVNAAGKATTTWGDLKLQK